MAEQDTWHEWDLSGLGVTQLRIDFTFQVHLWSPERDLLVAFGCPFSLHSPNGNALRLDPGQSETLGPVLGLMNRPACLFAASRSGRCLLRFADGTALSCAPHPQYEAWESHGTGGLRGASLLCGPGGGSPWGPGEPRMV